MWPKHITNMMEVTVATMIGFITVDFTNKFNLPILNALLNVTVGQRFDYNDPKLISLIERMTNWMKRVTNLAAVLVLVVPTLFKIFPKFLDYNQTLDTSHEILDMMKETIREHEESIDPNEPRDFTDKALIEIKGTTDRASSFSMIEHNCQKIVSVVSSNLNTSHEPKIWRKNEKVA